MKLQTVIYLFKQKYAFWANISIVKFLTLNAALDQFSPAWPGLLIFWSGRSNYINF